MEFDEVPSFDSWYSFIKGKLLINRQYITDEEYVSNSLINLFDKYGFNRVTDRYGANLLKYLFWRASDCQSSVYSGFIERYITYSLIDYIFDHHPWIDAKSFVFRQKKLTSCPNQAVIGCVYLKSDLIIRMIDSTNGFLDNDMVRIRFIKTMYLLHKLLQYEGTQYMLKLPVYIQSKTDNEYHFKLQYSNLYELASSKCFRTNINFTVAGIIICNQYLRSASLCDMVLDRLNN